MKVVRLQDKCVKCDICQQSLCPRGQVSRTLEDGSCLQCGACILLCPNEALIKEDSKIENEHLKEIYVNNKRIYATGLVKTALNKAGIKTSKFPIEKVNNVFMPCCTGGCWSCSVKINGKYALSCLTPIYENMHIETLQNPPPLRVVSGFGAHKVGGVGTPFNLKNLSKPVEAICFTNGCNLRCPQCQNYKIAFTATGHLIESTEAAEILLGVKEQYQVERVAISGGESTLNREWLLSTVKHIREMDKYVHIHLDTNGTILSFDYIDALVEAGVTDIGVDLKAIKISTFMDITGLKDQYLAKKYLETAWNCVSYIDENFPKKVFLGVGIPYNKDIISPNEVEKIGYSILKINKHIQVCLIDYRGEFQRKDLKQPSYDEMIKMKERLNDIGLKNVIAQTSKCIIFP